MVTAHSCASDTGLVRSENQDAWHADPAAGLFLVADGMGGSAAGGVASQYVAKFLPGALESALAGLAKGSQRLVKAALKDAIAGFSAGLRDRAQANPGLKGAGSTLALALVRGRLVYVANVGDSRAYLLERGRLKRLTKDHSVVAVMLELGKIDAEEAARHPFRGKLSRYVGQEGKVVADVRVLRVKGRARLLLCSDGLHGLVADARIASVLEEESAPGEACRRLVREANEAGGKDNVTALVVDLEREG